MKGATRKMETLSLSGQEMRRIGHRIIDMVVEHLEALPQKPVTRQMDRPGLEARLGEPFPEEAGDALDILNQLQRDVFDNIMHLDHPRFFAFVPSPSNFISIMADALTAGFNVFAGTWLEASGPAQIELVTIDWLRQLCGLPASSGGIFVSGGSMANVTALAVARQIRLPQGHREAVVYGSDQTHSSIERGLRVLGFTADQFRKLPTDAHFRLDLSALHREVEADRASGGVPFCVIANAGTTNTGAVDPIPALADFCSQEDLWLHVDGAYGAAAVLCDQGRALLRGMERADSLSMDPHKWLFQPYEIGCVLVREARWMKETFRILPEYLKDIDGKDEQVNFCDYGIQLTRSFRALKLWLSLKVFGGEAFREAVNRGFELARLFEDRLRRLPLWEVVTPAQMGIVTFRFDPKRGPSHDVDALNRQVVQEMISDGFAMLSSTELRGRAVLRVCTINPRTTQADVAETIKRLDRLARRMLDKGSGKEETAG